MKILALLLSLSFLLSSCVPAFLTAATITTTTVAQDKSMGAIIDDTTIKTRIKKILMSEDFKKLYLRVNVDVSQGRVMFTGEVVKEENILEVVDIAWKQDGVKEVINELKVASNPSFDAAQFAKDTWITTQVKARVIFNKEIKLINYTVITIRNVVYLFGIARSDSEMETIAAIASEVPGVNKVSCYIKLKEQHAEPPESK